MLLATLVQLHILLSAAPALAGWTPLCAALPTAAPGQAIYGLTAASSQALPVRAYAHATRSVFAAHGAALPAGAFRRPPVQNALPHGGTSSLVPQSLLRPVQKPRAP